MPHIKLEIGSDAFVDERLVVRLLETRPTFVKLRIESVDGQKIEIRIDNPQEDDQTNA